VAERLPDIPASCAHRPVVGGLVQPYVNVRLAGGGVDFRSADNARYEQVWRRGLCQTCGTRIAGLAVFFGGPNQVAGRRFDEPHVCAPCAVYVAKACPMVAGRRTAYASGEALAEGKRGKVCDVPGCGCMGWVETVPGQNSAGAPAHPWYAVYVPRGGWVLTAEEVTVTVKGRQITRTVINGGLLTTEPRKVVHVSEPGRGRVWQRIKTPPQDPDACGVAEPPKENQCRV
jgi:hypothetical protein